MNAPSNKPKATILDLDSMMDTQMSAVATLPDYVTPPAGHYNLEVVEAKTEKYTPKAEAGQPAPKPDSAARFRITYKIVDTIDVGGNELPPANGSLFSESFMATEQGLEFFKRKGMNIMNATEETINQASLKDMMVGLKGAAFRAAISIRKSAKPDGTGFYENVDVRPVHDTPPV